MTDPIMPDIDRARALLGSIGWHDVNIESVSGGTVNNTYRLTADGSTWYLRIGPTASEVEAGPSWFTGRGLEREQLAIAYWSDHQHLFPKAVHTDFTRSQIGSDWVIQEAVPGRPWEEIQSELSPEQSRSLWEQFGKLVAELHAYTSTEFGLPDSGAGFSVWSELCRWDAAGFVTDAHKFDLPVEPFQRLCDLIDRSTYELDEIKTPRLIHSDLGLRHVMVETAEDTATITGILDIEFARFADAYSESLFVAQALQKKKDPMFEVFLDAYGAERPDRDARLRSHIYQLVAMAWWVTDAARRQRPGEIHRMLDMLSENLKEAESV